MPYSGQPTPFPHSRSLPSLIGAFHSPWVTHQLQWPAADLLDGGWGPAACSCSVLEIGGSRITVLGLPQGPWDLVFSTRLQNFSGVSRGPESLALPGRVVLGAFLCLRMCLSSPCCVCHPCLPVFLSLLLSFLSSSPPPHTLTFLSGRMAP